MKTVSRDVAIVNTAGLHARPTAMFVKTAMKFKSEIFVELGDMRVNGKSVMGLMTLEASFGKVVHITATGEDSEELLNAVEDVIKNFVVGE